MTTKEYVSLALSIGEGLLRSGAEIWRVEDSIRRICFAYGAKKIHVFSLLSIISVTVESPEGEIHTQTRRLYGEELHLEKLERYNTLSRSLCSSPFTFLAAKEELTEIRAMQSFPAYWDYPASALAAGAFTFYFGGTIKDALSAGLIGLTLAFLDSRRRFPLNLAVKPAIFSFLSALFSFLLEKFLSSDSSLTFIGSMILLIPGLSVGNSIRDLLEGDLISGLLRLLQAIIIASAIAGGYAAAKLLFW